MTTKDNVPFAEIFKAMSEGKDIQRLMLLSKEWENCDYVTICGLIANGVVEIERFRVKPETIKIAIEVPEPVRVKQENYSNYYYYSSSLGKAVLDQWDDGETGNRRFNNGFIFSTKEHAELFGKLLTQALTSKS